MIQSPDHDLAKQRSASGHQQNYEKNIKKEPWAEQEPHSAYGQVVN